MSSIIDNIDPNTLLRGLQLMSKGGRELRIATAFFSLDALLMIADSLDSYDRIRILFGDDANAMQRRRLLELLRQRSDADLLAQREALPNLSPLKKIEALFVAGNIEARCYTAKKFHAKAYLVGRPDIYPNQMGVIGSGNFTRPGLTQNIELNVLLAPEQTTQLDAWYEERWAEAAADVVTDDLLDEIRRQIDLYDPYILYCKALTLWGEQQQERLSVSGHTDLFEQLDEHQREGFLQAAKIIEREQGVMICDGVGLGKSFIALALMERYCRQGDNVLIIAPKSILDSSWRGYLRRYLRRFQKPFGSIHELSMTDLGFDPDPQENERENVKVRREEIKELYERADVIVIDESHNFRTTASSRYKNLFEVIAPYEGKPKKTILLTATPINTAYRDLSSQIALITHEKGSIGGYRIEQIRKFANTLDSEARKQEDTSPAQLSLLLGEEGTSKSELQKVLESVVIQRSRKTCKALSATAGKPLHFPIRESPTCIEYKINAHSERYATLIDLAQKRFEPGVVFLKQMRAALEVADKKGDKVLPVKLTKGPAKGIKLAAFLIEQYRREASVGRKQYHDEVHLAALVFANTLKQLESSPVAFQGILQTLGMGLLARMRVVFGEDAAAFIAPHQDWVRTPLFPKQEDLLPELESETDSDLADDGDALDLSGGETDAWLTQAIAQRGLARKLQGFIESEFDIFRWRTDIVSDLEFLKEIHQATLEARRQPDPKLSVVLPTLEALLAGEKRILLFTQSQRTAEYLEQELKGRLPNSVGIARIDSHVEKTRAAILHAFCPGYNPTATAPSIPARVDILISTDVLSEGVNLQEAGAIFNYDIHWNPVRLIQRIGRVDRRLDPAITPIAQSFGIYNVLPPKEIDEILDLVGAIENRTVRISRTLGLDESFFKSTDPAGTLKEFNSLYDGPTTAKDIALVEYVRQTTKPDPAVQRLVEILPDGAFGVWGKAPVNGLFALFTVQTLKRATEADRQRFAAVIGRPVLALASEGKLPIFDAGAILEILSGTTPGEHSDNPSVEASLAERLKTLRHAARQQFADIQLPKEIVPQLVCWMELRKG